MYDVAPDESMTILGFTGSGKSTLIREVIAPLRASVQPVLMLDPHSEFSLPKWRVTRQSMIAKRELNRGRNAILRTVDAHTILDMLDWLWYAKRAVHLVFDEVTVLHKKHEPIPDAMYRVFNEGRKFNRTATVSARRYQQLHNEYIENAVHFISFALPAQGARYLERVGFDSDMCAEISSLKQYWSVHRRVWDDSYDICPPCKVGTPSEKLKNPSPYGGVATELTSLLDVRK